jgi:hypothetical protein
MGKGMRRTGLFVLISTSLLLCSPALAQQAAGAAKPLLQDTAGNCPTKLPFTHVLTNEPLPVMKADKEITPAVEQLHCTGRTPTMATPRRSTAARSCSGSAPPAMGRRAKGGSVQV